MRHVQWLIMAGIFSLGLLLYFMLMSMNDHIYDLEDRLVNTCALEVIGG
jgi:hypothetical protein